MRPVDDLDKKQALTMWPDVGIIKPVFAKSAQKVATEVFDHKCGFFKTAQQVADFGYFSKKICHGDFSKNSPIWSHWT